MRGSMDKTLANKLLYHCRDEAEYVCRYPLQKDCKILQVHILRVETVVRTPGSDTIYLEVSDKNGDVIQVNEAKDCKYLKEGDIIWGFGGLQNGIFYLTKGYIIDNNLWDQLTEFQYATSVHSSYLDDGQYGWKEYQSNQPGYNGRLYWRWKDNKYW